MWSTVQRLVLTNQAYSVTKAGSVQLCKSLAKACAPEVRVNAVAAGVMETEWSQGFSPAKFEQAKKKAALNKISDVEDVAKTYVDLIENGSMTVSRKVRRRFDKRDCLGFSLTVYRARSLRLAAVLDWPRRRRSV